MKYKPFEEFFLIPLRNGLTKPKTVRGEGYKMVNMGELFAFHMIINIEMDRVPLTDKEIETSLLEPGDLLFARQSLVREGAGQCTIFLSDNEKICFESHLIRVRLDKSKVNPLFYFYFFRSERGRKAIDSIVEQGAGASGIRGSDLSKLMVPDLEKSKQDKIVSTLYSLDNKIALNRKTNETLEQIAQALYKSWFVDFDPVKAKSEGRQPVGMDEATAVLFSDRFEESELGIIPKGWSVESIGEVAEKVAMGPFGSRIKAENFVTSGIPVIKGGNLTSNVLNEESFDFLTEEKANELSSSYAYRRDIIITHRGTIGQVGIIHDNSKYDRYIVSQSQLKITFDQNKVNPYFVYYFLRSPIGQHRLLQNASQVGVPSISRPTTNLKNIKLVIPSIAILNVFDNVIKAIYRKVVANQTESEQLTSLRNTLLPKLLSGEIAIPEGEKEMGV